MTRYRGRMTPSGTRLQAGIPRGRPPVNTTDMTGRLLRGVVTATYVTDDPQHPFVDNEGAPPVAVYCDVLVFGRTWQMLRQCLVCQERSGLHSGHVWKPRAASGTITGAPMDLNKGVSPGILDGDHVLVAFLEGDPSQPMVIKALPHPSADIGNEEYITGHRLKLRLEDGDPDYWKHNGSYYGIKEDGNFTIDTTHANDGQLNEDGSEPDPPTDGKGTVEVRLPQDASWSVKLLDMADPLNPVPVLVQSLTKDGNQDFFGPTFVWEINIADFTDPENPDPIATLRLASDKLEVVIDDPAGFVQALIDSGACFKFEGKEGDAKLTLGDGAVKAAVADHLKTLYTTAGTGIKAAFDTHTHPTGVGPSGPPTAPVVFPNWDPNIESSKLLIPDT
jgi:hypothetical protein